MVLFFPHWVVLQYLFFQGILDIIVLSKGYTKNDVAIHTLKNNFEADAYFVKVIGEYFRRQHSSFSLPPFYCLSAFSIYLSMQSYCLNYNLDSFQPWEHYILDCSWPINAQESWVLNVPLTHSQTLPQPFLPKRNRGADITSWMNKKGFPCLYGKKRTVNPTFQETRKQR